MTPPQGKETILLIDDEDIVRRLAARMLSTLGYTILEAATGEKAVELCQQHKETIHLVLTDVVMPQISGPKLVEQLRKIRNDSKIIYTTGYTEDMVTQHGSSESETHVLLKPYTRESLSQKVRHVLDHTAR